MVDKPELSTLIAASNNDEISFAGQIKGKPSPLENNPDLVKSVFGYAKKTFSVRDRKIRSKVLVDKTLNPSDFNNSNEHVKHTEVENNCTEDVAENQFNAMDETSGTPSNTEETCVVFVPETCTFQGASPVINGKPLDVTGHLKKSGLIKNTLYIRSDFLSDSQNKIPVYRPSLDIDECERILNDSPCRPSRKKYCLEDYKEEDLHTPELKQLHKVASEQIKNQSKTIVCLKAQHLKMQNKIKDLTEKIKTVKSKKVIRKPRSILTDECHSFVFDGRQNRGGYAVSSCDDDIDSSDAFETEILLIESGHPEVIQ